MPGGPNRPPEPTPPPPATPPVPESAAERALRRLGPARIALLLDIFKGAPSPELTHPFDKAETAYAAGDFDGALSALDALSIRFAEPRWPSLPDPFKRLRVPIPAPVPPHWDPDHALAPPERELRRGRRVAEDQLALAEGSIAWLAAHGVGSEDLAAALVEARETLAAHGVTREFYGPIDRIWSSVRERAPRPRATADRAPPSAPAPGPEDA